MFNGKDSKSLVLSNLRIKAFSLEDEIYLFFDIIFVSLVRYGKSSSLLNIRCTKLTIKPNLIFYWINFSRKEKLKLF
ncbi:hypothetical protein ANSO36C_41950 [Nostoc cf. commune SO-36]|uniref:Uncharacterized protein n=1 Tax=Nostoc cf. commune SO-36 TaxID=449208 RepID=A0ABM7Z5R6_NOSCO|nr:hypothetical protein ANSO36C_41950 [Nostoc cf. commune SO-36]